MLAWGQPPSMHRRPHSRVNRTSPSSAPASASAVASRFRQRLGRRARRPDRPRQGHVARIVRPLAVTRWPARSTAAIVGPKVAGRSSPRRGRRLADRHAVGARARPTHPRTLGRHGGAPTGESAASVRVLGAGLPRFPRPAEHAPAAVPSCSARSVSSALVRGSSPFASCPSRRLRCHHVLSRRAGPGRAACD